MTLTDAKAICKALIESGAWLLPVTGLPATSAGQGLNRHAQGRNNGVVMWAEPTL